MRFSIEAWAPEYGAPLEGEPQESPENAIDVAVEQPAARWAPVRPRAPEARTVLFTDGVRRVDARVWIDGPGSTSDTSRPGICASYAAGAVLADGRARIVQTQVQRGLFTAAPGAGAIACRHAAYPVRAAAGDGTEQLSLALQQRMGELEIGLAAACPADIVVVDGPLRGRTSIPCAVGLVKTHRVAYLPDSLAGVIGALGPGERTPLFLVTGSWSRFSCYLRLPGATGHSWAGVVRLEATADADVGTVVRLADTAAATLPRFASALHKDPRAPQNLYPISGLERELKRRLGDASLLYRELRLAACANPQGLRPSVPT
ncbi:MAG TPA: hypothetical protein VE975_00325 [Actinomycetota bacterium]|nr:hypothetical protein [Actinomycetota bacterium]